MSESRRRWPILLSVTVTNFAIPYMMSAVGVSLPVIGRSLGAGTVELTLIETVYICSVAMFLLPMGRLADIVGRGFLYSLGIAIFTTCTLLLGLAVDLHAFLVLRFFQGLGGALINATNMAIITGLYPRGERGRAFGIAVTGVYVGVSLGPFIGGLVTTALGWRWLFFTGAPVCFLALVLSLVFLPVKPVRSVGEGFDWAGSVLIALTMGLWGYGSGALAQGGHAWWVMIGGGMALAAFIQVEKRVSRPLLEMALFLDNPTFTQGNLSHFINYTSIFGVTFLLSLYLQYAHGMTPQQAGAFLVVQPVLQAVITPISGRLADRLPPHYLTSLGMALSTAGLGVAALCATHGSLVLAQIALVLLGLGAGLFSSPNTHVIMGSVTSRHYGMASAMTAAMRTVGMSASMLIITVIVSHRIGSQAVTAQNVSSYEQAMQLSLFVFCAICLVGVILSLRAPDQRRGVRSATRCSPQRSAKASRSSPGAPR